MLEALGVSYAIGGKSILARTDLNISAGRTTVLIGPNGAGKSTLFKILTGELRPTTGSVRVDNQPIATISPAALALRRAVVPQSTHLSFPFTVLEVVRLGAHVPGLATEARRAERSASLALRQVGLGGFEERLYLELSGGERQRVHLARALCQIEAGGDRQTDTPILMLDEPTASLDLKHQIAILELVRDHSRRGWMALVVLHDLNLAAAFADQLVVLWQGRITAVGNPNEILTDELLSGVYGCPIRTNVTPAGETPFVLPQAAIGG